MAPQQDRFAPGLHSGGVNTKGLLGLLIVCLFFVHSLLIFMFALNLHMFLHIIHMLLFYSSRCFSEKIGLIT